MRAWPALVILGGLMVLGCPSQDAEAPLAATAAPAPQPVSNVPPLDPTNIVSIAIGSEDHSTLVAALQAADYVTSVAASGPLTVFAPTNAAFEALPAGTVEGLLEPANADQLREVLKYHVTTSALGADTLRDGQSLGMANGAKAIIRREGETLKINDATVLASIRASNGIVHVVDGVLLPPEK